MEHTVKDKVMVQHLNTVLKNELTAINQYFLHAKILKHEGFATLAAKEYAESIDEMKHADMVADRILFLGGLPNFQDLGRLAIGETVEEMLNGDFQAETKAVTDLKAGINHAHETGDYGSEQVLTTILTSEEEHYLWLQQQLRLIKSLGLQNYLQSQV